MRYLPDAGERINALGGWSLLGVVLLSAVQSVFTGDYLWAGFEAVFVVVAALPVLAARDLRALVPWPVLLVGAASLVAHSLGFHEEITAYAAVAALSLVVVVELDAYTDVEMSRRFAIAFAVLTTMAVQGLWTVVRYYADQWLGTEYVAGQADVQWDFVFVTLVAVVVGVAFERYFDRTNGANAGDESNVTDL